MITKIISFVFLCCFMGLVAASCDIPNVKNVHLSDCLSGTCKDQLDSCFDDLKAKIVKCGDDQLCTDEAALSLQTCLDEMLDCTATCVQALEDDLKN